MLPEQEIEPLSQEELGRIAQKAHLAKLLSEATQLELQNDIDYDDIDDED